MPHKSWGRFTLRGSDELELHIRELVQEVAARIEVAVRHRDITAVVLFGGYGRGEGGVARCDGRETPHNNLDFLLVTPCTSWTAHQAQQQRVDEALAPLAEEHGIGLDFSVVSESSLRNATSRVMWYDMRFGHKTILGDAQFLPSLNQFTAEQIPAWNVRDLMTNRGTLLVLNDLLAEQLPPSEARDRQLVRHAIKAVIGYGDALLYFLDDYHWSYATKQQRMQARRDVPEEFRRLYDEAIDFRFAPDYETFQVVEPLAWHEAVRETLAPIHLWVETLRLAAVDLDWSRYLERALRGVVFDRDQSPRRVARKLRNLFHPAPRQIGRSLTARLGGRLAGAGELLPLAFPVVAFDLEQDHYRRAAARIVGAADTSAAALRAAYVESWGRHGDHNLHLLLERFGVELEPEEVPA